MANTDDYPLQPSAPPALAAVPPQAPPLDADGIPDFSRARKALRFRVDGDVFEAAPALPMLEALALADVQKHLAATTDPGDRARVVVDIFGKVLLSSSLERFTERLSSREAPIDAAQFGDIIRWLFAEYGGRPTPQPSDSPNGSPSPDGGTSSTGAPPSPASTPAPSRPIAS